MTSFIPLSESETFPDVARDWAKTVGLLNSSGVAPVYLSAAANLSDITNLSAAQFNLGLIVGTDVQAFSSKLTKLATAASVSDFLLTLLPAANEAGFRSLIGAGTVTQVNNLVINTTGTDISAGISNSTSTPTITLSVPTASASNRGLLSSANWSTFNGKQDTLVSGTSIKTFNSVSLLGSGNVTAVTSVDGSGGTTGLTLTGGPITGTGTLTLGGTLAATNGGTGVASLSALKSALSLNNVDNTSDLAKPISTATQAYVDAAVGSGGVTLSTSTPTTMTGLIKGTGSVLAVAVAGTDYIAPSGALGTPSSGNLSNCTVLPRGNVVDGITAGTNAQGQCVLTGDFNVFSVVANNPGGATLPVATVGRIQVAVNRGANPINLYPQSGATIDGQSANTPILLAVGARIDLIANTVGAWQSNVTSVGAGTVTSVSVTTANGVSGSVATNTTTPAITLTLGAITPSSVAAIGTIGGSNFSGTHSGTSSGTNTGDQTITLTGDVTGSGTGSFVTAIGANKVTLAMQAQMATGSLYYRKTAGTGNVEVQTLATLKTDLLLTGTNSGDQTITLTGAVTGSGTGSFATTLAASIVGLSNMTNLAQNTIIGRVTASTGTPEALTAANIVTIINTTSQTANTVWAAPNGGAGAPSFRALVVADIPTLNQNTTGSAATLTTGRTVAMTGDVAWTSGSFNGSANVTGTSTIGTNAVSFAKFQQISTANILGRVTAATGNVESLTGTQVTAMLDVATTSLPGTMSAADKTKLNGIATSATANSADATLLARANHTGTQAITTTTFTATARFGGRITAAAGAAEELTGTQATTLLNTFTTSLKGLVPASGGGTTNFMRADGTWAAPGGTTTNSLTINNGGSGAASGSTFNGSSAVTISYNTVGAPSTTGTGASGTWGIAISGNAATATSTAKANSATSAANATFYIVGVDTTGAAADMKSTTGITMNYSTNALNVGGNVSAYSDERLKKNWRPVQEDFVAKLANIKSGVYDRIDLEISQAGVSAQELQLLLPETVNEDTEGMLNVAYGNAALVSAIELAKLVVDMRSEIAAMRIEITNLKGDGV